METVRQLLRSKGNEIWSVSPETTAFDALELMAEKNIGALLVKEEGKLVGIFSERDYARKVILKGKSSKDTPVKDLMTEKVYYIKPGRSLDECMSVMTRKKIRHLPVVENGELLGVITIGDVVKTMISEQVHTIEALESYITGRGYGA